MNGKLIEVEGLTIKDSRGRKLVRGVSLQLGEREFVGIVGESGAGKSITVQAILGVAPERLDVTYTRLLLLGENPADLPVRRRRTLVGRDIGFVPQNTIAFLHPQLKIKNQIADAYCYHFNKRKREGLKRAEKMLEKVGISDPKRVLNSYPFEISGGMKQRVNIAMALMTDPKLIIADEPTTALDAVTQKQVMDLFQQMNEKDGIPILFISHDLNLIRTYCDRVYVMNEGQVVEEGATARVFNHPEREYTKKLLASVLKVKREEQLPIKEGGFDGLSAGRKGSYKGI